MVHWYILLIYIINVPYFYGTSQRSIKGHLEVILNLFRSIVVALLWCLAGASIEAPEAPFLILYNKGASLRGTLNELIRTQLQGQKEDFSDLVELMVAIFKENIGPISNDVTAVVVVVVAFFWCHTGRRKIFAIYF